MIPGLERSATNAPEVKVRVRSVLIVDEAVPIRQKLVDILQRAGVDMGQVHMSATAEEALEIFALQSPNLIFCELVGDGDRGISMVLEMLHVDPNAKIVIVTADDPESAVVRTAIRAGAFGVVRKPLRHEAIRQILSEIEAEEGGIERYR